MARITKKQVKEDKFVTFAANASLFFSENWKKITGIGVAAVVVIGAIVAYAQYMSWKNDQAVNLLNEGLKLYDEAEVAMSKDGNVPANIEKYGSARAKFQEAYEKGGGKSAKPEALFYSAKCAYQMAKYSDAIPDFEIITKKYPKSMLAMSAREGIAKSYEQMGDNESLKKAVTQYDELSKYPESYITVRALINKGRCLEKLGEKEQAEAAYKSIVDKFKIKVEASIQEKSKTLVQKAKEVISKYESALGKDQSDANYSSFLNQAKSLEGNKQEQWFETLKAYDKAIFSRNEYWYQQKAANESTKAFQEAEKALQEYENESMDFIKNAYLGHKSEEQGDWSSALRYYNRAIRITFLPDMDLYNEAKLQLDMLSLEGKQVS